MLSALVMIQQANYKSRFSHRPTHNKRRLKNESPFKNSNLLFRLIGLYLQRELDCLKTQSFFGSYLCQILSRFIKKTDGCHPSVKFDMTKERANLQPSFRSVDVWSGIKCFVQDVALRSFLLYVLLAFFLLCLLSLCMYHTPKSNSLH
jgi:hypothetical protein